MFNREAVEKSVHYGGERSETSKQKHLELSMPSIMFFSMSPVTYGLAEELVCIGTMGTKSRKRGTSLMGSPDHCRTTP